MLLRATLLLVAATVHAGIVCDNDCDAPNGRDLSSDAICHDGGPGAEKAYDTCPLGHDCTAVRM